MSSKTIESKISENYIEYQNIFIEFQSKFLIGLHKKYQGLENGNLILYFAKQSHENILRQKNYDLNFDISHDNFWANHNKTESKQQTIIKIAEDTLLPKETARRKILQLIKQKIISKDDRDIRWLPDEQYKKSYNLFIAEEIKDVAKLINFISKKINLPISNEEVKQEIKKKFSFYWFHYLGVQLQYLRLWREQFDDLDLIIIFLQVASLFASKAKEKKLKHGDLYKNPSLLKEYISASISATSVAEVTGISRATCVRKLKVLVKLKALAQDKITKRYYLIPNMTLDNLISEKINKKVIKSFSDFFFICLRAMNVKILDQ